MPKATQPGSGRGKIQTQAVWIRSQQTYPLGILTFWKNANNFLIIEYRALYRTALNPHNSGRLGTVGIPILKVRELRLAAVAGTTE